MSSKRLYQVFLGAIILMVGALLGGAYVINNLLETEARNLQQQKSQVALLTSRDDALKRAKQDIAKYQELANIARSIVPQDKDQAQTVSEIVNLANQSGVHLGSITFPASTLGATGVAVTKPDLSQLAPVKGIPGVYSLQIIVQDDPGQKVPYDKFISFLQNLEHNRRTALVNGITITPDGSNPKNIDFTLILQEYIKP